MLRIQDGIFRPDGGAGQYFRETAVTRRYLWSASAMLSLIFIAPCSAAGQEITGADSGVVAEVKALVRRTNPELRAREAAIAAAEARVRAAGSYGPVVLSAELEEVPDGIDVGQAGSLRLDLSRELFSGGLNAARRGLATGTVDRARRELALTQRSLLARADAALAHYLGGIVVTQRLAAQDSLLAGAQDAVTSRFAVGAARYVDVIRLRTERLRIQVEAAQARTDALHGRRRLLGLVEPQDTIVSMVADRLERVATRAPLALGSLSFPSPPSLDSLVSASASIQLAEVSVRQAEAGLRLARASQRMRTEGSVGVQRFGAETGGHDIGPTLGVSVTLPFTASKAGRATRQAAEQDLVVSRAELRATLAGSTAVLGAARDRYVAALANLRLFEAAQLQTAREERENALAGYRTGSLSLLELLDFERALTQAEISRTRSIVEASEALSDLLAGAFEVPERTEAQTDLPGEDL